MNRTDGLVRRNKNRGDNGSSEPNSSTANSVDDNDVIINERDDEIDDNDSKETRLTLMEEVLLLGLKDKEVKKIAQMPNNDIFVYIGTYMYLYAHKS